MKKGIEIYEKKKELVMLFVFLFLSIFLRINLLSARTMHQLNCFFKGRYIFLINISLKIIRTILRRGEFLLNLCIRSMLKDASIQVYSLITSSKDLFIKPPLLFFHFNISFFFHFLH